VKTNVRCPEQVKLRILRGVCWIQGREFIYITLCLHHDCQAMSPIVALLVIELLIQSDTTTWIVSSRFTKKPTGV